MKRTFFVIPLLFLSQISATAVAAGLSRGDIIEAKRTFKIESGTVETAVILATPKNPYSCYLKHDPASNTRFIKKGSRFQIVDDKFSIDRLSNRELVELIARAGGTVSKDILQNVDNYPTINLIILLQRAGGTLIGANVNREIVHLQSIQTNKNVFIECLAPEGAGLLELPKALSESDSFELSSDL